MPTACGIICEEKGRLKLSFPDCPECLVFGSTREEVIGKGSEALGSLLAEMSEQGEPLPTFRLMAEIRSETASRGGEQLVLVNVEAPPEARARIG